MNQSIKFHGVEAERLADGSIRLTQQSGSSKPDQVILHPDELVRVGRALLGSSTDKRLQEKERQIAVLADRLSDIVCSAHFRNEIISRCGSGDVFLTKLDALTDLAFEWSGIPLLPCYIDDEQAPPAPTHEDNDKPSTPNEQARADDPSGLQMGLTGV